jgi:hypothetical protein
MDGVWWTLLDCFAECEVELDSDEAAAQALWRIVQPQPPEPPKIYIDRPFPCPPDIGTDVVWGDGVWRDPQLQEDGESEDVVEGVWALPGAADEVLEQAPPSVPDVLLIGTPADGRPVLVQLRGWMGSERVDCALQPGSGLDLWEAEAPPPVRSLDDARKAVDHAKAEQLLGRKDWNEWM